MTYVKYLVLVVMLLASPFIVQAAALELVPTQARAGQEFALSVKINPGEDALNVVEGSIDIPEGMSVSRVSTGGSALAVWTVEPSYSRSSSSVSFTGGVMGAALPQNQQSLLFTLYVYAPVEQAYTVNPHSVYGFRADGTGTRLEVAAPPLVVQVGTSAVETLDTSDYVKPTDVVAELGNDPALFDNAPFIFLYARDDKSGIAKYAVKEGWLAPYVEAQQYYVLRDATASRPVWVRATDTAGNSRSVHVAGTGGVMYYVVSTLPYLLVLFVLGILFWRLRARKQ